MDTTRSFAAIEAAYEAIAGQLAAPRAFVRFATTPRHDGSPHIELHGSQFAYVITERGCETERRTTGNSADVLYWLVSDLTRAMAAEYELAQRSATADSRRLLFHRHLELLESIRPAWQARKQAEYANVLKEHPFRDESGGQ